MASKKVIVSITFEDEGGERTKGYSAGIENGDNAIAWHLYCALKVHSFDCIHSKLLEALIFCSDEVIGDEELDKAFNDYIERSRLAKEALVESIRKKRLEPLPPRM